MKYLCVVLVVSLSVVAIVGCGQGAPPAPPVAPGAPSSASSSVTLGAQLGYLWLNFDSTLRPIFGVPGGSQIGPSAVAAGAYRAGAGSAATQAALLEDKAGSIFLLRGSGGPAALADGLPVPARIVFSAGGSSAVAFVAGGNSFWSITGLPSSPLVQRAKVNGAMVEAAIGDDGTALLALRSAAAVTIDTWTSLGGVVQIASVKTFGGMGLIPASTDVLVADGATGDVLRVHGTQAATAAHGLKQPYALGVSSDGHWALVAVAGGMTRVDLLGASPAVRVACACTATEVTALSGVGLFRVTEAEQGPTWMVDIAAEQPRAYFIPPAVANKGGVK